MFAMAAAALITALVATGASTIQSTGAARTLNTVASAVDARFGLWADQMDAGTPAGVESICYSEGDICASIAAVSTTGEVSVVTIEVDNGGQTLTRVRSYRDLSDAVMVGFADGAPVWSETQATND